MVPDAPAVVVRANHGQEDHLGSGFPRCHGLIGAFPAKRLIQISSQDCLADRRKRAAATVKSRLAEPTTITFAIIGLETAPGIGERPPKAQLSDWRTV